MNSGENPARFETRPQALAFGRWRRFSPVRTLRARNQCLLEQMKSTIFLFHPGDLVGADCLGTLLIVAFPMIAILIVVYVFVRQRDKS